MIRIEDMKFSLEQIAKSEALFLTGVSPIKEFVDGKATNRVLGFRYQCVCPQNKFEHISIKVEEKTPSVSAEMIEENGTLKITPVNFEAKFYRDKNGTYQLTAKADKIEVIL